MLPAPADKERQAARLRRVPGDDASSSEEEKDGDDEKAVQSGGE
jgi:hypothetical protein